VNFQKWKQRILFHWNLKKESTHRLAMGVAVGVFVSFAPTIGFQPFAAILLAILLNGNKLVAIAVTSISNPLTFFPIFYPSYRLGAWIFGRTENPVVWESFANIRSQGFLVFLQNSFEAWKSIFFPVLVGSLVVATTLAVTSYYLTSLILNFYRNRSRRPD